MAVQQIESELEQKLEGFISAQQPCRIVVTNTNGINTRINNFHDKTGLTFKSERDPVNWASFAPHIFPQAADYARMELLKTIGYKSRYDQNIQIELLPEEEYQRRYSKVRSVHGARRT